MNINIRISLFVMLAITCLCACNKEDASIGKDKHSGIPADGVIRVFAQVNNSRTRAGLDNTNFLGAGRQFGLFVTPVTEVSQPQFTYSNARMVYKNGIWNEYASDDLALTTPLNRMFWYDSSFKVEVQAYMPYHPTVSSLSVITDKIGTLQNEDPEGESVVANDYLYFNGTVNPLITENVIDMNGNVTEYPLKDGKIAIPFKHVASKLNLRIKLGTVFNISTPGTTVNPITNLKINGTSCDFDFDLTTGVLSATGNVNESVVPWYNIDSYAAGESYTKKALADYECILVPQTVAANKFSVSFTINGKDYMWASKQPVVLIAGKQHNLSLDVGENAVLLSDFTINDWGISDIPISPDVASPIEIDPALTVPGEDVELSLTDMWLHFRNTGGSATLTFTGDYDKEYKIIDGDSRLTIEPQTGTYKNNVLKITATQLEDGNEYITRLLVTNPLLTASKGIELTISVDGSEIRSVEMGGLTWMEFNGIGRSLSLYRYSSRYSTREIYAKDWGKFSGLFMWGPRATESAMLYPWDVVSTPIKANPIINTTTDWTQEYTNIPCPEGWRLPTFEEYGLIFPDHMKALPVSYQRNGVQYKAFIEESGCPEIPIEGGSPIQTKLFIISDGTNELIIPMTGWHTKDPTVGQNAGKSFFLWAQNRGSTSNTAKLVGLFSAGTICNNGNIGNETYAYSDSYHSIRCVKIK